ncbi:MAG: VCBS repeat-containing protein [Planctomycetota bacterium]
MLIATTALVALAAAPQSFTAQRAAAAGPDPGSTRLLMTPSGAPSIPDQPFLFGGGVASGDIDRDGDQDLVIATAAGPVVWDNAGAAGFVDETSSRVPVSSGQCSNVVLEDVNDDGWLDLIAVGTTSNRVDRVLANDRTGRFVLVADLPSAGAVTSGIAFVDVDGDGDRDLVRSIGSNGHVNEVGSDTLLANDGAGNFSDVPGFQLASWNDVSRPTTGVLAFDANGDGIEDLLWLRADSSTFTGSFGSRNSLVLGLGNGRFAEAPDALPDVEDNSYGAVAHDIDGDGDLDVVVSNVVLGVGSIQSADVLVNQGGAQGGVEGEFLERVGAIEEMPIPSEALRLGIVAGDIDLDGSLDVVFEVHDLPPGGNQPVYLGTPGTFSFGRLTTLATGTFIAGGATLFDADGDGDLDLFMTASGSAAGGSNPGAARLYRNTTR